MASGVELAEVDLEVDEDSTSASAAITSDRAVELVGFGSFHVWLTLILTLGNAADAVERYVAPHEKDFAQLTIKSLREIEKDVAADEKVLLDDAVLARLDNLQRLTLKFLNHEKDAAAGAVDSLRNVVSVFDRKYAAPYGLIHNALAAGSCIVASV